MSAGIDDADISDDGLKPVLLQPRHREIEQQSEHHFYGGSGGRDRAGQRVRGDRQCESGRLGENRQLLQQLRRYAGLRGRVQRRERLVLEYAALRLPSANLLRREPLPDLQSELLRPRDADALPEQ